MERLGQTRAAEGKRAEKVTECWMGKKRGKEGGKWKGRGVSGWEGEEGFGWEVKLTDRPYGDRLSPTGELLRSALTNAVGGDAGKVNSTKPFQGLPILFH